MKRRERRLVPLLLALALAAAAGCDAREAAEEPANILPPAGAFACTLPEDTVAARLGSSPEESPTAAYMVPYADLTPEDLSACPQVKLDGRDPEQAQFFFTDGAVTYVQYQFSAAQWDSETDFLEAVIALHSLAAGQYAAGIHTTMHFDTLDTPQDFDAGVRYASIWLFGNADTQLGERVQMELSGGGEGPTLLLYFYSDTDTAHNESYRLYLSEQG